MATVQGRHSGHRLAAAAVCISMIVGAVCAHAQPAAAAAAASEPATAETPASAASSAAAETDPCVGSFKMCASLRVATLALIEAAKYNNHFQKICTVTIHNTTCSATSPQPYVTVESPAGNPAQIAEGKWLLDWYLANLNCETICKPKKDVQACVKACVAGKDVSKLPKATSAGKAGKSKPKPKP